MWLYDSLSFRAMVSAGMNPPLHGASERESRNLPSEWPLSMMWLYAFLSFRAIVGAGMNPSLHGASERKSRNLPSEWSLSIMTDFSITPVFLTLLTLLTEEGA